MDVEGANEENVDNSDNFNLNISDDEIHNMDNVEIEIYCDELKKIYDDLENYSTDNEEIEKYCDELEIYYTDEDEFENYEYVISDINLSDNTDIEVYIMHRKIDLSDAAYENIRYIIKDKEDCNENIPDVSGNVTHELIIMNYGCGQNKKVRLASKIYITRSNGEVLVLNNYLYMCLCFLCRNPRVLFVLLFCIGVLIIRLTMV